jgi:hypothetical protein
MAVPQNMNAMLDTVNQIPDYLRPENIGNMEPIELRHHRNEYRRIKAVQDANTFDRDGYANDLIPATAFWGSDDLLEELKVEPYSPFGSA